MTRKLAPVRNVRSVDVRTCGTCALMYFDGNESFICLRTDGPIFSAGDQNGDERHGTVCDRWRRDTTSNPWKRRAEEVSMQLHSIEPEQLRHVFNGGVLEEDDSDE